MLPARLKKKTAILKDRRFRTFFAGNVVSKIGDAPVPVAFSVAAYQIESSASGITLVLLSLWGARFLMVSAGGSIADRFNRVRVMIGGDIVRIVAQGGLALTALFSAELRVWQLCLSAAVYGIGAALYAPAQIGLTPELATGDSLQDANGLLSIVADVGFLAGPVLAGVLMSTLSFTWVLWIDVATFVVNLALLLRLTRLYTPLRERAQDASPEAGEGATTGSGFAAGLRLLGEFKWFGYGMGLWFVISVGIGMTAVAGPAIAIEHLGGIGAWSALATCLAVGSLLGSLVVLSAARQYTWKAAAGVVTLGVLVQSGCLALHRYAPLPLMGAAFVISALAVAACAIVWDTSYQRRVPERHLSRFGAIDNFVNSVGTPIGMLIAGLTADHYATAFAALSVTTALLYLPTARLSAAIGPPPSPVDAGR